MKKDVLISIKSTQAFEDLEEDEIELVTSGRFYRANGKYFVTYEETELTGLLGTRTTLKISDDEVILSRTGASVSQMHFIPQKRHVGMYPTEAGLLSISTYTNNIDTNIDDNGGKIIIDYTIEVDHKLAGINHFELMVTEK